MHPEQDGRPSRRTIQLIILLLLTLLVTNIYVLNREPEKWLPSVSGPDEQSIGRYVWRKSKEEAFSTNVVQDEHPIRALMDDASHLFRTYEKSRSKTFKQTVEKYRERYGRHPPPGFKEWYKFARRHRVHNIDDFDQINSDLRPFWAVPPVEIRHYAAHASDIHAQQVATVSLRQGQVFQELWGWRSETFVKMLSSVAQWLPDMDIPINRMDQPRVVVPWEEMQAMLEVEERSRPPLMDVGARDGFTGNQTGLWRRKPPAPAWWSHWNPFYYPTEHVEDPANPPPDYGYFWYASQQQYMDLAAKACPPDSYARNPESSAHLAAAEASYKLPPHLGDFITNSNASSDLCTVGPQLANQHGMLFAANSIHATHKLIPIFGECKVNVNNDILFPANMYWTHDKRYEYNDAHDIPWPDKDDVMTWRGVTSGGLAFEITPERWKNMHRQRLVALSNATALGNSTTPILADSGNGTYTLDNTFQPFSFAAEHTDVGFTEFVSCIPNSSFYERAFELKSQTSFAQTFKSKFLVDVDGHSFSGRWRAFLQSRSLGIKATIFREWHDSRLFAWKHFVPLDNRFDDLYGVLSYFIGVEDERVKVTRHDEEAHRIAAQGRQWAGRVLRREDMEIYLFRLLLEYGRVIDDGREGIGVLGDGGREMEEFDRGCPAV